MAQFDAPGAHAKYEQWRAANVNALEDIPAEAVRIDTGRGEEGDFVRVYVDDPYAGRFATPSE